MTKQQQLEEDILQLIDNQDDFTRSDLQGVVSALVMKTYGSIIVDLKKIISEIEGDTYTADALSNLIEKLKY